MPRQYPTNRKPPARPTTPEAASSLIDAVRSDSRRAGLLALRDHLATVIPDAVIRDKPALVAQLRAVLTELDAMPLQASDPVDEIRRRMELKRTAAGL